MKTLLSWIYGLQCFLVVPWFLGAFYRREMSPSIDVEFQRVLRNNVAEEALLTLYGYALFYSLPIVLSYINLPAYVRGESRKCLSIWIGLNFLLFLPGIIELTRSFAKKPGWEICAWAALTAYVAIGVVPSIRRDRGAYKDARARNR
jgi:hypothetical protein